MKFTLLTTVFALCSTITAQTLDSAGNAVLGPGDVVTALSGIVPTTITLAPAASTSLASVLVSLATSIVVDLAGKSEFSSFTAQYRPDQLSTASMPPQLSSLVASYAGVVNATVSAALAQATPVKGGAGRNEMGMVVAGVVGVVGGVLAVVV